VADPGARGAPRVHSESAIAMPGVHGSFTPAETEVPLLITET